MRAKQTREDACIEKTLAQMSLEQRVGQCFTYLWSGHLITPSVIGAIEQLHCGGLRLQPAFLSGKRHQYYNFDTSAGAYDYPKGYKLVPETLLSPGVLGNIEPEIYAERLNRLQAIAAARPGGVPLHMVIDQEGDLSRNFPFGGASLFPAAMGQVASGDPKFVYEINRTVARQLSAMGINAIHSPVLDVNINPDNPEIGIRAYGDDPGVAAEYGAAAARGLRDGGLIPFAKHFPGRGDSSSDAHFGTPQLNASRRRLDQVELVPFRRVIEAGIDGIMIAHNIYRALDPGVISTVSRRIITDLLRGELGFQGVVTTDAIAMQALMKVYPLPEACARALQAGADLVLNKTETGYRDQGFFDTLKFVQKGLIPEDELNDKVRRILRMKVRLGLFKSAGQVDAAKAGHWIQNSGTRKLASEAARRAIVVMRDRKKLLPLKPRQKILVVEQRLEDVFLGLNAASHRLCFTEAMFGQSMNIVAADTAFCATEKDEAFILPLVDQADVVVMTNDYNRSEENNSGLLRKILKKTAKVVVVANTPYPMAIPREAPTAICTFASTPESHRAAAAVLFGVLKPAGRWPLKRCARG